MQSEAEVKAHIAMKAAEDDEFRARLLADPRAALEEATGLRLPPDYRLHVHEESATDRAHGAAAQAGAQPGATGQHRAADAATGARPPVGRVEEASPGADSSRRTGAVGETLNVEALAALVEIHDDENALHAASVDSGRIVARKPRAVAAPRSARGRAGDRALGETGPGSSWRYAGRATPRPGSR